MIDWETEKLFEREVWIAPKGDYHGPEHGKKDQPFVLSSITQTTVHNGLRINLLPGLYWTNGLKLPKRAMIYGPGAFLKLNPNVGDKGFNYPHIRLLGSSDWLELLIVEGLTLDGNIYRQDAFEKNGNFKTEPLAVKGSKLFYNNVTVLNWGVNGADYGRLGLEAMPLSGECYASGDYDLYFPAYDYLKGKKEDLTFIQITDCYVGKGECINGGYATMGFVRTCQGLAPNGQSIDRQPPGHRQSLAALVARNTFFNTPLGIGFGCASSEAVRFEDNIVRDCKVGMNVDWGGIWNIEVKRNQLLFLNQGINLTPNPGSGEVRLKDNVIILTDPFYNPVTKAIEPFYYINHTAPKDFSLYEGHNLKLRHTEGPPY